MFITQKLANIKHILQSKTFCEFLKHEAFNTILVITDLLQTITACITHCMHKFIYIPSDSDKLTSGLYILAPYLKKIGWTTGKLHYLRFL